MIGKRTAFYERVTRKFAFVLRLISLMLKCDMMLPEYREPHAVHMRSTCFSACEQSTQHWATSGFSYHVSRLRAN